MVMHLACVILHMNMPEVLNAATINAAYALNSADKHGSLEVGKYANFLILHSDRCYFFTFEIVFPFLSEFQ